MFWRPTIEMVIVDLENLDFTETRVISWILSMLATVVVEMETVNLLRW